MKSVLVKFVQLLVQSATTRVRAEPLRQVPGNTWAWEIVVSAQRKETRHSRVMTVYLGMDMCAAKTL